MPIEIDRFREESDEQLSVTEGSVPDRVLAFLDEHDSYAFTAAEVADRTDIKESSVRTALSRLERRGLVEHKGTYYAVAPDDRRAAREAGRIAGSGSVNDDYYGG